MVKSHSCTGPQNSNIYEYFGHDLNPAESLYKLCAVSSNDERMGGRLRL